MQEAVGRSPSDDDAFENIRQRVVAWCEEQETEGRLLLLVCDTKDTSWTRWCLEQSDRIVVVAKADATSEIERIDRAFAGREVAGSAVEVDLLLIREGDTELPRGTGRWMDLLCRRRHYHVRLGNAADFRRAVRHMSERAVGVVLGDLAGESGWRLLRNRLNPISPKEQFANIFQILMWATTLSSKQYLQQLVATGQVDLFLTPPVQEFQLLGFDVYEKLYQIGYEYTRKQLAEWDCLQEVATGGRCTF